MSKNIQTVKRRDVLRAGGAMLAVFPLRGLQESKRFITGDKKENNFGHDDIFQRKCNEIILKYGAEFGVKEGKYGCL